MDIEKVEKEAKNSFKRFLSEMNKASPGQQLLVGAASGWCTGMALVKVGKTSAFLVGGSILLLQYANQRGYVKINWKKVMKGVEKVTDDVEKKVTNKGSNMLNKASDFAARNTCLVTGFLGGFFIGLSFG